MTVEHLIEVLGKFDKNKKVFIKTNGWNGFDYTEIDASIGAEITEEDLGIVIELGL